MRALLYKELREHMPATIVGVVIFLATPAVWCGVYRLIAPRDNLPGELANLPLLLFGWLYAAVVAAQGVCRDFGRGEGDFLLARPVDVRSILRAKVWVSFHVVFLPALVVAGWGLCGLPHGIGIVDIGVALFPGAVSLFAFWIAFVAAAVTRHTLSSVMLTGLVLVLLFVVPLITPWPAAGVSELGDQSYYAIAVPVGLFLLVLVGFVARTLAPRVLRSERGLRLGNKTVAWTIGSALVFLIVMATREVGHTRSVDATYWLPPPPAHSGRFMLSTAVGRRRVAQIFLTRSTISTGGAEKKSSHELLLADLDAQLRVVDARTVTPDWQGGVLFFDAQETLYVVQSLMVPPDASTLPDLLLQRLDWASGSPDLTLHLPNPADADCNPCFYARGHVRWSPDTMPLMPDPADVRVPSYVRPRAVALHDGELYVESTVGCDVGDCETAATGTSIVATYQFDAPAEPTLKWAYCNLPPASQFRTIRRRVVDGRIYFTNDGGGFALDPSQPDGGLHGFPRWGGSAIGVLPTDGLVLGDATLVRSVRAGLFVVQANPRALVIEKTVGRLNASPLSMLFRDEAPILAFAGPGYVWEAHRSSLVAYDLRDPTRPKRVANVATPWGSSVTSGPEFLVRDNWGDGFSIVRHPGR